MTKLLDVEKENRRIGEFKLTEEHSPNEVNWFEPDTVSEIDLKSNSVYGINLLTGKKFNGEIDFSFTNNEENKTIELRATLKSSATLMNADPYIVDEMKFAQEVYDVVQNYETEEDIVTVKEGKEALIKQLQEKLFSENNVYSNSQPLFTENAFGFLVKDNKRHSFVDQVDFKYDPNTSRGICMDFKGITGYVRYCEEIDEIHIYDAGSLYIIKDFSVPSSESQLATAVGFMNITEAIFENIKEAEHPKQAEIDEIRQNFPYDENTINEYNMTDFMISRADFVEKIASAGPKRRTIDIL